MTEQRRIDLLFAAAVAVVRVGRFMRRASPAVAALLVAAVLVNATVGGRGPGSEGVGGSAEERASGLSIVAVPLWHEPEPEQISAVAGAVGPGWLAPLESPVPAAAPVVALDSPVPAAAPVVALALDFATPDAAFPVARPQATAPAAVRTAPALSREQQNIARFIAQRYRVTLDSTVEFVHHAYRAARDMKLDPLLLLAIMSVESSFNPLAQSHAGAQGLMQVHTRVHQEKFLPFGGIAAAFDPVANIRVGSVILKGYLQREGSVEGALKSYVGSALAQHDNGYGVKVLNARDRIAAAAAGRPIPPEVGARAAAAAAIAQARARQTARDVAPEPPALAANGAPEPLDSFAMPAEFTPSESSLVAVPAAVSALLSAADI